MKRQRLVTPMLKNASGELVAVQWEDALIAVSKAIRAAGRDVAAVAGGLADAEVTERELTLRLSFFVLVMGFGYDF